MQRREFIIRSAVMTGALPLFTYYNSANTNMFKKINPDIHKINVG
jgi:hypothetical protein